MENLELNKNKLEDFSWKDFSEIRKNLILELKEKFNIEYVIEARNKIKKIEEKIWERKILKFSFSSTNITFETIDNFWKKEIFIFNVSEEKFEENIEQKRLEIPKKLERWKKLLDAMERIFENNNKEVFWELDKRDILDVDTFWEDLKWKNLIEIQMLFRKNFLELETFSNSSIFSGKQEKDYLNQQKKYLEILSWTWDKYEWTALFLLETQWFFNNMVDNIIKKSTNTEVFVYISRLQKEIDLNFRRSETVKKANENFLRILSESFFEKLKAEPWNEKEMLILAKFVIWKWKKVDSWFESLKNFEDEMKNYELSTKILTYLFTREWWLFSKLWIKNFEKDLQNTKVSDLLSRWENLWFDKNFFSFLWKQYSDFEKYSKLWEKAEKKYEELTFDEQILLSSFKNIIEKYEKKWNKELNFFEVFQESILETGKKVEWIFSKKISPNSLEKWFFRWKELSELLVEWSYSEVEREAFDLFKEIDWSWLFRSSYEAVDISKTVWKMIWIIGVSIIAATFSGWMSFIWQWAVVWATWSVASLYIFPKWYDTPSDMILDLSSDLALWTVTWAMWWQINKIISTKAFTWLKSASLNWFDIAMLWFIPEYFRETIITWNVEKNIKEENQKLENLYKKREEIKEEERQRKLKETLEEIEINPYM